MKAFLSVVAAFVLLLNTIFVDASAEGECRRIQTHPPGYDYCVRTLGPVPGSSTADVQGLAIIATNLVLATWTHNLGRARELLNSNLPAEVKRPLQDCVELFDSDIQLIDEATVSIKSHDAVSASIKLEAVQIGVSRCIDNWNKSKQKPLMLKENEDALNISQLAFAFTLVLGTLY